MSSGICQPAQTFDLPLRRAGPQRRVGTPTNVIGAEPFNESSHQRGADVRLGNERSSKHLTDVAVHVAHAVLFWDVGEIARPGNAAGTFEFRERDRRIAADVAVGRVIDDEVEVRPVLRRLPDIRDEDAA